MAHEAHKQPIAIQQKGGSFRRRSSISNQIRIKHEDGGDKTTSGGCGADRWICPEANTFISVNKERVFTEQEIYQKLSGRSVEPTDIARLLARFDGDGDKEFDGVKVGTLLSLNSYDVERDCFTRTIRQRREVCYKLSHPLQVYCKFCLEKLESVCTKSLAIIMKNNIDVKFLLDFERRLNEYIAKANLLNYPLKLYITDYLYSLSQEEREKHQHFCNEACEIMKRETVYLNMNSWRYGFLQELKNQDQSLHSAMMICVHVTDGKA